MTIRSTLVALRPWSSRWFAIAVLMLLAPAGPRSFLAAQDNPTLARIEEERTDAYAGQLEAYLRKWLVDDYPQRAAGGWNRDYRSVEAFLASVEPNRMRPIVSSS